jgi:hypothetical protein
VTGFTQSRELPMLDAAQPNFGGFADAFVATFSLPEPASSAMAVTAIGVLGVMARRRRPRS